MKTLHRNFSLNQILGKRFHSNYEVYYTKQSQSLLLFDRIKAGHIYAGIHDFYRWKGGLWRNQYEDTKELHNMNFMDNSKKEKYYSDVTKYFNNMVIGIEPSFASIFDPIKPQIKLKSFIGTTTDRNDLYDFVAKLIDMNSQNICLLKYIDDHDSILERIELTPNPFTLLNVLSGKTIHSKLFDKYFGDTCLNNVKIIFNETKEKCDSPNLNDVRNRTYGIQFEKRDKKLVHNRIVYQVIYLPCKTYIVRESQYGNNCTKRHTSSPTDKQIYCAQLSKNNNVLISINPDISLEQREYNFNLDITIPKPSYAREQHSDWVKMWPFGMIFM